MTLPTTISANLWTGDASDSSSSLDAVRSQAWALRKRVDPGKTLFLAADEPPDLRDWSDPRVGWGLVLAENETIDPDKRALAEDAPEPIRRLWEKRGRGPVFRYRQDRDPGKLRRYAADGTARDPKIVESEEGTGEKQIPRYLLIFGGPDIIPWEFQYELNLAAFAGRLDLDDDGLDHYVTALLDNWSASDAKSSKPLVWSVDHGGADITRLMRKAIAEPVIERFQRDSDIKDELDAGVLLDAKATGAELIKTLAERKPAFVLTTSHGMTGPLDKPKEMKANLGVLVDHKHQLIDVDELHEKWSPGGAIWYAHACCGAGSTSKSCFSGLIPGGESLDKIFDGVAALGSTMSPLPRRLLSCENPIRAFIGHVEPTFNWTIRDPRTSQVLTSSIRNGLYHHLFRRIPETVGMAFKGFYNEVGPLFANWRDAKARVSDDGELEMIDVALHSNLAALDRRSMVILGDPTVALPPL